MSVGKFVVLRAIRLYQRTLSFDHGWLRGLYPYGFCRYSPTCSQYGYDSVDKHGVVIGGALAVWRILRCNPFARGGQDPVPDAKGKNR